MRAIERTFIHLAVGVVTTVAAVSSLASSTQPEWYYSDVVDFAYVQKHATVPKRDDVLIVDSRPVRKYDAGYISPAVNIPGRKFDDMIDKLPADKSTTLIFYCGGLKCPLSHKSAVRAQALGYTNIKVYAGGYPDWIEKGGIGAVSAAHVKKLIDKKADVAIVDSRPKRKFDKGHVPGAVNIPDRSFDALLDRLPRAKDAALVFYCGGYNCKLSPQSAAKAVELGYSNVKLFQAGYPAWVEAYGAMAGESSEGGASASAAAPAAVKIDTGDEPDTITLQSFRQVIAKAPGSVHLIDVRDPEEFDKGALPMAVNMTVDQVEEGVDELPTDKPIVFVCATGARSGEAYDIVKMARSDLEVYFLDASIDYAKDGSYTLSAAN